MEFKDLVFELCQVVGVAGREDMAVVTAKKELDKLGKTEVNPLGSLICEVLPKKEGRPHLMLDAHIDEIGMIVTFIDEKGFLRVGGCGGMDRRLLLSSTVFVHTENEVLRGVVCSLPPHLQSGERKNPKVDEIAIDIGFSAEEAKKRVALGDRVTLKSTTQILRGDLVSSKSLDDRIGCASIIKAAELIKKENPDIGLTVVLSTMEETGGQGAKTAAYTVNPTHALAVDVSFAHTPDAKIEKCGEFFKGPMVGFSPILASSESKKLVALAKENGIPYQTEVMGGRTSTNADEIAVSRGGVTTSLLSIPQRYMHTPIETVSLTDAENTAKLIAKYALSL